MKRMGKSIEDFKWIRENYQELLKRYNKMWIAVNDKKVIDSSKSLEDLKRKMRNKKDYIFEYITDVQFPSLDKG